MFTFDLLRVALTHGMSRGGQVPFIDSGPISIKGTPGQMINHVPEPPLLRFAPHKTPHFIDLRGFHAANFDGHRVRTTPFHYAGVDLGEAGRFFLIP
jgi:hypothetical protein